MLYDDKMRNTNKIELTLKDDRKITICVISDGDSTDFLVSIPKETCLLDAVVTVDGYEKYITNNTMIICSNISINESNLGLCLVAKPNTFLKHVTSIDGKEKFLSFVNMNIPDDNLCLVYDFKDIKEINADSSLWVALLNYEFIDAEEEILKKYDVLPMQRIYGVDEFGKPKVKKYIK